MKVRIVNTRQRASCRLDRGIRAKVDYEASKAAQAWADVWNGRGVTKPAGFRIRDKGMLHRLQVGVHVSALGR